jgi:hypothetical protein
MLNKSVKFAATLIVAILCSMTDSFAQGAYRVIIMGEDSDPSTVRRTNDIYKRVLAEIRRPMKQKEFDLLDEDIIAAQLDFIYQQGMSKSEILQAVMLANKSKNVNTSSQFLVLLRIHIFPETLSFTKQVHARIDGEIYDINNGLFIESYEVPESIFPVPSDCNAICLTEQAGAHAHEIAGDLGTTIAKQLTIYLAKSQSDISTPSSSGNGASVISPNSYTFILKNFKAAEVSFVAKNLREKFSSTVKLDLVESSGNLFRYQFITKLPTEMILDNLHLLISELGLTEDDIKLNLGNQIIFIEKLRY